MCLNFLLAFLILSFVKFSLTSASTGCTALPLVPDKPFVVVWNHPTNLCEDQGVHLDFGRWGIVDNNKDSFKGEKIVLFYNLGKWPYYNKTNEPVNGGIPQLSNLTAHLNKVESDFKTNVGSKTFNGLGVIDMEYWRPLYQTNFDSKTIYQQKSRALVKQRFPHFNKSQVLKEAIREFESAARDFLGETLLKANTERPDGKWGYYLFPRCFDPTCNASTIRNNDKISWLFKNSTGLYPSIYFKLSTSPDARALKIKQTLKEAFRVKAKFSAQDIPIMPYSKSQEGPYRMYQSLELSEAVLQPADMGSSGVVIWGKSVDAMAKNECLILRDYLDKTLGPFSLNLTNFFGNCSQKLCQGHGRCVRKDYERIYQFHLRDSGRSECLIWDEALSEKHNVYKITKKRKRKGKGPKAYGEPESLKTNNRPFHFVDYIKDWVSLNFHWGLRVKPIIGQPNRLVKTYKSTLKLTLKSSIENQMNEIHLLSQKARNTDISVYKTDPTYNFDDYVCKCYRGFTGIHCENSFE